MRRLYELLLRLFYHLSWPLSAVYLNNSQRARVIVMSKGRVLLVRTSIGSQRWDFPGGGVKRGEDPQRCAQRELREETGITLDASQLKLLGEQRRSLNKSQHGWPHAIFKWYSVQLDQQPDFKVRRPLEIIEIGWFDPVALPNNVSPRVQVGLDYLKTEVS